jgi:hypothetical protein
MNKTKIVLFFAMLTPSIAGAMGAHHPELIHKLNQQLTYAISYDKFTPPPSSRIYAYANVAAYEVVASYEHQSYRSLAGQLKDLTPVPTCQTCEKGCLDYAVATAFIETASGLIFHREEFAASAWRVIQSTLSRMPGQPAGQSEAFQLSADQQQAIEYGKQVAAHILNWSSKDRYLERTALPRYQPKFKDPSKWITTPPSYLDALEPNWPSTRTWVLKSPGEIECMPHNPFSTDTLSLFWKEAKEVYNLSKKVNSDEENLAWFWDDNCKATEYSGHFAGMTFKQTPVGHWIAITAEVCRVKQVPFQRAIAIYAHVAVAMADAVHATWFEKYRSELVRPVTYIQRYIDPLWMPILETPQFPEHPSGHGAISAAAAVVLAHYVGDAVTYTDSSTLSYGREPMVYHSLLKAAHDAAFSRFYGGIHYRTGCIAGNELGKQVGALVVDRINLRRVED